MELSKTIAALALILGVILVTEYARATEARSGPNRAAAMEAQRRVALAEHQRRKEDFVRLCAKPLMSRAELEACRAAYRRL